MKNIKSFIAISAFAFVLLFTNSVQAQTKKVTKENLPAQVKETLKGYPDYKFEKFATIENKSNLKQGTGKVTTEKVYRLKLTGNRSGEVLVIDENGKILAIETGETKIKK